MGALGKLLMTLIVWLTSFFGRFLVLEKAFKISSMIVFVGLVTALVGSLASCAHGVCANAVSSLGTIHPSLGIGFGIVFNTTTYTAASCYMAVWMLCQLYVMKKKILGIFLAQG